MIATRLCFWHGRDLRDARCRIYRLCNISDASMARFEQTHIVHRTELAVSQMDTFAPSMSYLLPVDIPSGTGLSLTLQFLISQTHLLDSGHPFDILVIPIIGPSSSLLLDLVRKPARESYCPGVDSQSRQEVAFLAPCHPLLRRAALS